jgi:hypothetical protein
MTKIWKQILFFLLLQGSYQFGYDVGPNGQFHHEKRGPDGITYGCYGYIDPDGRLRATHYIVDQGYRVVTPKKPVTVYPPSDEEVDQ